MWCGTDLDGCGQWWQPEASEAWGGSRSPGLPQQLRWLAAPSAPRVLSPTPRLSHLQGGLVSSSEVGAESPSLKAFHSEICSLTPFGDLRAL